VGRPTPKSRSEAVATPETVRQPVHLTTLVGGWRVAPYWVLPSAGEMRATLPHFWPIFWFLDRWSTPLPLP
jgi:hypothetical protein